VDERREQRQALQAPLRWWQWPVVLSLDAPAVSLAWLALLSRSLRVDLEWPPLFVLGASVWLAYAADRWIEGWRLPEEHVRTPRHRFYQRWRGPIAAVWVVVLAADIAVALTRLTSTAVIAGWVVTAAVATYLLSHQHVHRTRRWRLPKEICVALLLTAGIGVFLVGAADPVAIAPLLTLFAAVCFVNCALISAWEREVDRVQQQSSLALDSRIATWIPWMPWLLAAAATAMAVAGTASHRPVALCAAASALLLALVDRLEPRLGWRRARVLADLVLLTPFLRLPFGA
jgi:hypothetical protein